MKSPLWILTVLLPLVTELAAASPTANPDSDSLDSFEEFEERDMEDRRVKADPCRYNKDYWYYKYPCDSSDKEKGKAGAQFDASCKYKSVNSDTESSCIQKAETDLGFRKWYKTSKGWVRDSDKPPKCSECLVFYVFRTCSI